MVHPRGESDPDRNTRGRHAAIKQHTPTEEFIEIGWPKFDSLFLKAAQVDK